MTRDPTNYIWWLTSRAAGVTAFALASAAVIAGLMLAGKLSQRPGAARTIRSIHEHAAIGALIAVAVHGLALLGDRWMHPGLGGILVPFQLSYRPLATGVGIITAYLMALLGLSFYFRRRIGARLWRSAHRLMIVVWAMAAGHALTAGTDASTPWMRAILGASTAAIAVLFVARLRGGRRRTAPRPRPTSNPALEVSS